MPTGKFYALMIKKILRMAGKSLIFRFVFKLLFKKGNILAALREPKPVIQFGIAVALFQIIFHLVRRIFANLRQATNPYPKV